MFINKNEKALDPTKIEISARIKNRSISEELRYDISSADIKKEELDSLFLKYPHRTRVVMLANEVGGGDEKTEIHFTMEGDIELEKRSGEGRGREGREGTVAVKGTWKCI